MAAKVPKIVAFGYCNFHIDASKRKMISNMISLYTSLHRC